MASLNEENYWQLLELVASPDVELDTDLLANCLYSITEGSASEKNTSITHLIQHVREFLPDFASNQ